MRALVIAIVVAVAAPARADEAALPTIDAAFPPAIELGPATGYDVELARVAVSIEAETTWVTFRVHGHRRGLVRTATVPIAIPAGARVVGIGITSDAGRAWGRPLPTDAARALQARTAGSAVLAWHAAGIERTHLELRVDLPATVELALQLPALPRLAVEAYARGLDVELAGRRRVARAGPHARAIVELDRQVATTPDGDAHAYPHVDARVAVVAAPTRKTDFLEPLALPPPNHFMRPSIDKAMIRRRVKDHRRQITRCYERVAQWHPEARGTAVLQFRILPDGTVEARIDHSDLPYAVDACLVELAQTWTFAATGETVLVNYPFRFSLAGT